jgi:hypothetical protein
VEEAEKAEKPFSLVDEEADENAAAADAEDAEADGNPTAV